MLLSPLILIWFFVLCIRIFYKHRWFRMRLLLMFISLAYDYVIMLLSPLILIYISILCIRIFYKCRWLQSHTSMRLLLLFIWLTYDYVIILLSPLILICISVLCIGIFYRCTWLWSHTSMRLLLMFIRLAILIRIKIQICFENLILNWALIIAITSLDIVIFVKTLVFKFILIC